LFSHPLLRSLLPVTTAYFIHVVVCTCEKIPSHNVSARAREDFSDFSSHRLTTIFWPGPASARWVRVPRTSQLPIYEHVSFWSFCGGIIIISQQPCLGVSSQLLVTKIVLDISFLNNFFYFNKKILIFVNIVMFSYLQYTTRVCVHIAYLLLLLSLLPMFVYILSCDNDCLQTMLWYYCFVRLL